MASKQTVSGRYELKRKIGTGGMSTVHLALDTRLEREVAVKILAEHLADDPAFISRFRREALAAAKLLHPNIVQVFDSGLDEDSGRHFIVMEYVPGLSCAAILRKHGALLPEDAVDITIQACRGLQYAHRHGVIHRDVKPGNLLRSDDGVIKLADFGIALAAEQSRITQAGSVLGTASYLSPEQARGEAASPASDFYALGVVAYQLLSGRLPYEAPSLAELTLMREERPPTPLLSLSPDLPPELAHAVELSLELDPADRFSSGEEFEQALVSGLHGHSLPATKANRPKRKQRAMHSTEATAVVKQNTKEHTPRQPKRSSRPTQPQGRGKATAPQQSDPTPNRSGRLLLVLLLLAGIGTAAYFIFQGGSEDQQQVRLRNVIESDVSDSIESLKLLIQDNTQQ